MPDNKNKGQNQSSQKDSTKIENEDTESVSNENEDLGNEVEDDDRITQRSPRQGGDQSQGQQDRNPQGGQRGSDMDRGK